MRKVLSIIHIVVLVSYALPNLLFPVQFWALYGVDVSVSASVIMRILGGIVLGNATFAWLALDPEKAQHILPVFMMEWGIMFIVTLPAQLAGLMNVLGWSNPIMAGLWVALLAYLRFASPQPQMSAQHG